MEWGYLRSPPFNKVKALSQKFVSDEVQVEDPDLLHDKSVEWYKAVDTEVKHNWEISKKWTI